ncbi:MAG: hypothetical protein C5B59_13625 [Bacteroidetes bacterium]|nr:MAG: hypothetical protein C5B59_13625 [Bacteroidota bacterium]
MDKDLCTPEEYKIIIADHMIDLSEQFHSQATAIREMIYLDQWENAQINLKVAHKTLSDLYRGCEELKGD